MSGSKVKKIRNYARSQNVIDHRNTNRDSRRRLPIFTKKKNNTSWVEIEPQTTLQAIFYAINAGVSHLLIPHNTGKCRIVLSNGKPSIFTKYQDDYLALANSSYYEKSLKLSELQNKFLSTETVRSAAAVLVEWYVLQEADANLGNIGFTNLKSNVYRLDYDYTMFDFIATELNLDKTKINANYQLPANAHHEHFSITESDLINFPNCKNIYPINHLSLNRNNDSDVEFLQNLNMNADFMKYVDLYFLKSILIKPDDARTIFDMHVKKGGAALRRRYVNYLDQRLQDLKSKLFGIHRFRENFRSYFDEYKQIIIEEHNFYNDEFKNKEEYKTDVQEVEKKLDWLCNEYLPLCQQLEILKTEFSNQDLQNTEELFKYCHILLNIGSIEEIKNFIQIISAVLENDDVTILIQDVKKTIYENLRITLENQMGVLRSDELNPYRLAILDLIDGILDKADSIENKDSAIVLLMRTEQYTQDLQSLIENGQMTDVVFIETLNEYKQDAISETVENIKIIDYKTKTLAEQQAKLRAVTSSGYAQELADFVEHISDYLNSKNGLELDSDRRSYIFESTNKLSEYFHSIIQDSTITEESFVLEIQKFFECHQGLLNNLFENTDKKVRSLMFVVDQKNIEKLSIFAVRMASACMYAQELFYEKDLLTACSFLIKINSILRIANEYENDFESTAQNIVAEINKPNIILGKHRGVKNYLHALLRWVKAFFNSSVSTGNPLVDAQYGFATKRIEKLSLVADAIKFQL